MLTFDCASAAWGISFVDITVTNVIRGNSKERSQQRNWETVLQTVGLLSQPIVLQVPEQMDFKNKDDFNVSNLYNVLGNKHKFNLEFINPNLRVWMFAGGSERPDVFGEKCARLNEVFDLIPVIPQLNETIQLNPSVFYTNNPENINIQFFPARTSV